MGRLFGLTPADPRQARVLELGCADGANLLPMAQHAPQARFLGLDASAKQAAQGQAAIAGAKLTNVEIRHQNILEFPASEGKFDYIIVHGIFSWVPEEVREKILAICRDHLDANGIAYISYNAFPGWGMRMALRDMMLFHTRVHADPKAKVGQARALTAFLAEAVPTENNPYGLLLKQELERMKGYADNYLRHDILEETNQPFYFYQFMQRAAVAGLQYLSETTLDQMLASNFSAKVNETLSKVGNDIVAKEQYMDFVRNRNFRQTLLCHQSARLGRNLTPDSIKSFYYTSVLAKPEPGTLDLRPGVAHAFKMRTGGGAVLNADHAFLKAVFDTLAECGLRRISFTELLDEARVKAAAFSDPNAAAGAEESVLSQNLLQSYARGVIDIYADRPVFLTNMPEKPVATQLARYQALNMRTVTNHAHQPIQFDIVGRYVLAACDGQHDFEAIVASLVAAAREGKLRLSENNTAIQDESRVRAVLTERARATLIQLASLGFFAESRS